MMNTSWKEIEGKELFELVLIEFLSDQEIAAKFDVSAKEVKEKRRYYRLAASPAKGLHDHLQKKPGLKKKLDEQAKFELLKKENVDSFSKVITNYAFRSGPIEDIHADGRISQVEMKALNKYMVNRLAGLLEMLMEEEWFKLFSFWNQSRKSFGEWDPAVPDKKEILACYAFELEAYAEKLASMR